MVPQKSYSQCLMPFSLEWIYKNSEELQGKEQIIFKLVSLSFCSWIEINFGSSSKRKIIKQMIVYLRQ